MTARWLAIALVVEARKAVASRVLLGTSALLVVGVAAISAGAIAGASGNEQLASKLGPLALEGGWPGVLSVAVQVTAAAGMLALGVGLSWMFGREFADGTVTGLFGLPVSRPTIATAKLLVYLLWAILTALVVTVVVAAVAWLVALSPPDGAAVTGLARLLGMAVMTALLPIPAAWAATLGRGLLPAIGTTVALMAATQIIVAAGGTGAWFPLAAPALWAISPAGTSAVQLALVPVIPIVFALLTVASWSRLQLDR